jgi:hypothetical protein
MKHIPFVRRINGVLSGAALAPFVGLPAEGFRWQTYASAYQPMMLEINYVSGMPGSFFTVTGFNFPQNDEVTILVNNVVLGPVATDSIGSLIFLIDSTGADVGHYSVITDEAASPRVQFQLDMDEPLRPQEGEGVIFTLPAGIAYTLLLLPIVLR